MTEVDKKMSPTLRREASCLFLPPLIPSRCLLHALLPEGLLQRQKIQSLYVHIQEKMDEALKTMLVKIPSSIGRNHKGDRTPQSWEVIQLCIPVVTLLLSVVIIINN